MNLQTLYNLLDLVCVYSIAAVGQNLLVGFAGIPAVAPTGFGAVAGYLAAYIVQRAGVPTLAGLVVGVVIACIAGAVLCVLAMRLNVEYVILITVAFAIIIIDAFENYAPFGGEIGLVGLPPLNIFGITFQSTERLLPLLAIILAAVYLVVRTVGAAPFGVMLRAMRADQPATRAIGLPLFPAKVAAFVFAAGTAGLAGALLVFMEAVANPSSFGFTEGIIIIAMLIMGGLGSPIGPLAGAVIVEGVPQLLQTTVHVSATEASLLQEIIFGVVLVVVMLFWPRGLVPERPSRRIRRIGRSISVGAVSSGIAQRRDVVPVPPGGTVLAADGLVKNFGGLRAMSGFTFSVSSGELVGLVGPNGAGKTTLFNLLTGAISADRGHVTLLGERVSGLPTETIAVRGMVRSFQDVRLFTGLTVLENVTLAALPRRAASFWGTLLKPREVAEETRGAVARALDVLDHLGISSLAENMAAGLSFGEQKLVALARAVATGSPVLLLDEPTAGVGAEYGRKLRDVISQLHHDGFTIVLVEHNLEVVGSLATRIIYLELGSTRAEGSFEELIRDPALAESYFGTSLSTGDGKADKTVEAPS